MTLSKKPFCIPSLARFDEAHRGLDAGKNHRTTREKSSVNPESRTGKRDESGRERVVLGISQARSDFREPTCDDWKKFGKNKRAYVVARTLN